jgi:hypothetical protein
MTTDLGPAARGNAQSPDEPRPTSLFLRNRRLARLSLCDHVRRCARVFNRITAGVTMLPQYLLRRLASSRTH